MTLREYVEDYIKRHNLSMREFARLSGVNHEAISKIINQENRRPDFVTLEKIAAYTGVSVISLLKMVYPDAFKDDPLTPQSELVAQAFENAPESVQDLVLRLVGLK